MLAVVVLALGLVCGALAEDRRDHRAGEDTVSATTANNVNTPPTRQQILVHGFKEAGLTSEALRTLDQAFRQNPRLDEGQFQRVLDQVRDRNGALLTADQVQDLKRLYDQALSGVQGETGRELSAAAQKALRETETAPTEKTAGVTPQPKGQLSQEAVDGFLKGLNASLGKGVPAQEAGAADTSEGLLSERGALAALEKLLGGKDKDKDEGDGRGDRERDRPPFPPGAGRGAGDRVRDEDRSKKGDDSNHKLLEALKGRDQNRGGNAPAFGGGGGGEKEAKAEQKEAKSGGSGEEAPKRKRDEEEPPKKDDKKSDFTKNDASSLLDSLSQNQKAPAPKKSALPPMAPDAAGGLFGGNASASALGGAAGVGAGALGGGMLGGGMLGGMGLGGGGGFSGSSAALSGGDPFASVGMAEMGGDGVGPGGPGYMIAKEGGYVGGTGGGGGGEDDVSAGDFSGGEDDLAPYVPPARIPTYAEQIINMTPTGPSDADGFLLQRYVGYVGKSLCSGAEAQKAIGICQGLEAKRQRAIWWERMSKGEVSKR